MYQALLKTLLNFRFVIIIAVIASLFASIAMLAVGTISIAWSFMKLPEIFTKGFDKIFHPVEIHIITGIDAYLVATVLIVFAIGLYELFIYPVSTDSRAPKSARALIVTSIDQLKEKISKLVIMVLVVLFFKNALSLDKQYSSPLNLLYLGLGIFFVALALYFGHSKTKIRTPFNRASDQE